MRRVTQQGGSRAGRVASRGVCALLACLLLLLVGLRAADLRDLGGFGVPVRDALLMAAGLALAGTVLVLLRRSRRRAVPWAALAGVAAAVAIHAWLLLGIDLRPELPDTEEPWVLSFGEPYGSHLEITFLPELRPGTGALVVGALGLLPVAGLVALLPGRAAPVPRGLRAASLLAAAVAAALVQRDLDRALGLQRLLQWQPQQLGVADAVTTVAGLWALCALLLSATALWRGRARALAVVLPFVLLMAWGALLLADPPRRVCCYSYGFPAGDENPFRDYGVLLVALLIGLAPLAIAQLRRVRTSPSTPSG